MKYVSMATLFSVTLLAGCATQPSDEAPAAPPTAAEQQAMAKATLTGSRIQGRQSTDRLLKGVSNQDFRDSVQVKSIGNTTHPAGD